MEAHFRLDYHVIHGRHEYADFAFWCAFVAELQTRYELFGQMPYNKALH